MEGVGMANNHYKMHEFKSREILTDILAHRITKDLLKAIDSKGFATLVLSGGSTPLKLLQQLSLSDIAWDKVRVTLVDERWVDTKSQLSNEKLVRDNLLKNNAKNARFIPLKNDAIRAKDGAVSLEVMLKGLSVELDVVVLGMGLDAHTASFFPHATELQHALTSNDLCCATTAALEPRERMTLTRSFLLGAKDLILHIEGKEKREVFNKAALSNDEDDMPIVAMMQQSEPILEVYYAD
jgi:6-phosphogluconolactonase